MAQQRLETLRSKVWSEFSNATALAQLMQTPTESEPELADANPTETITVAVAVAVADTARARARASGSSFRVQRQRGVVRVLAPGDLGDESMLLVAATVQWRDLRGPQERTRKTIVYRSGLTRSGIFGSALGRPASTPVPLSSEP